MRGSWTRRNVYQESTACRSIFPANASPSGRTIAKAGHHHEGGTLPFAIFNNVWYTRLSSTNRNLTEERWMDITYVSNRKKFNYRVCAIIISNNKILAMHDERSPYFYLPGGRVQMGETAEHAVVREVEEELNITPKIIRPLWLNQSFFTEDVDKLNYHEICIYYLMDISETGLLEKGERFTLHEGHHIHDFEWLAFERLQDEYFYPIFLKTNIYNLPKQFTIRSEYE